MWGKHFASTYTGSMYGAGPELFAVWGYVIANTVASQVELNPVYVGPALGMTPEAVAKCIDQLCAPDPNSRSKRAEGRRLVREGQFAYFVPNHMDYRGVRDEQDRREYNRKKKAEGRARGVNTWASQQSVRSDVNLSSRMSSMSAQAEAEAEAEAEADTEAGSNLEGVGVEREIQKPKKKSGASAPRGKPHWVRECAALWQQRYNGKSIPWGQIGKLLKPVSGEPDLLKRLGAYFAATKPEFVNLVKFVQTFGSWGNGKTVPQTYSYEPGLKGPAL